MKFAPYTASKLNLFKQCNRRFKYKYVDKLPIHFVPTLPLTKGKIVHLFLEHHSLPNKEKFQKLITDRDITKSEFYTKELVQECFLIYQNFTKTDLGKRLLLYKNLGNELHIGLDKSTKETQYLSNDVMFRGIIDSVFVDTETNIIYCIDWKTGKDKSEGKYKQPPDQLLYYASWYFEKFPVDTIVISYVFVEHENKELSYTLTRDNSNRYKKFLIKSIIAVEKENIFEKDETKVLCDYCEFQEYCENDLNF